jgi:hypothetical protein
MIGLPAGTKVWLVAGVMNESLNSKPQRRTYSPQFKAELVAVSDRCNGTTCDRKYRASDDRNYRANP